MKWFAWLWVLGLTLTAFGGLGCASDDVRLPQAELVTPGAFVAIEGYDADRKITLIRTIDRLDFQFETLLFFSTYDVEPTSFEQAAELAKQPEIGLLRVIDAQPTSAITTLPWKIVWFRTLTEEEQRRAE
ncbi:MAG TPA: hypothetical protein PK156_19595 [Polyangium sp.]|nr:hypothetical protein [Polyangium sp.]